VVPVRGEPPHHVLAGHLVTAKRVRRVEVRDGENAHGSAAPEVQRDLPPPEPGGLWMPPGESPAGGEERTPRVGRAIDGGAECTVMAPVEAIGVRCPGGGARGAVLLF